MNRSQKNVVSTEVVSNELVSIVMDLAEAGKEAVF